LGELEKILSLSVSHPAPDLFVPSAPNRPQ
jgi:hypothetical protein